MKTRKVYRSILVFSLCYFFVSCDNNKLNVETLSKSEDPTVPPERRVPLTDTKLVAELSKWHSLAQDTTNLPAPVANGRLSSDDIRGTNKKIDNNKLLIWTKGIVNIQKDNNTTVVVVPTLNFKRKQHLNISYTIFTKAGNKINGFEAEIELENTREHVSGKVKVQSISGDKYRIYKIEKNKVIYSKSNARIGELGGDLAEVVITATRPRNQAIFSFGWEANPYTYYASVEPQGEGGCSCGSGEVDKRSLVQWIAQEAGYGLTEEELNVLVEMDWVDIANYFKNIFDATEFAAKAFGLNGHPFDGTIGNAYKHAMLAALNSRIFGYPIALQLGNAHENNFSGDCNACGPGCPNCNMCMDLFNNNIGYNMGQNMAPTQWHNYLMSLANSGQLKTCN